MIPVTSEERDPRIAPALIDAKSGDVFDRAGDRIGRSEPVEMTAQLSRFVSDVAAGRQPDRVLMDLAVRDVDSGTGYGIYSPTQDMVADQVSTIQEVDQVLGSRYYEDPLSATLQALPNALSEGAQVPLSNMAPIKVAYECLGYGVAADVPFEMSAQADFDLLTGTAYRLALALRLAREQRVATLLLTAGSWAAANQRAAAVKWNGGATADPITDIYSVLASSTLPITHLVMSEAVLPWFAAGNGAAATRVQNFFFTIEGAFQATNNPFPKIIVAKGKLVASAAASYIWGSPTSANVALIRQPDSAQALSSSRTFRYTGSSPDGVAQPGGYLLRKFYINRTGGRGANGLVLVSNDIEKVVSNKVGGIITGVIG